MIYYFYSENGELKGLLNYKRMKIHLFNDIGQAVAYSVEKHGVTKQNPVGFIYKCTQIQGQHINAYKSEHPLQIIGCEKIGELI